MGHLSEQEMILHYYGESGDGGRIRRHLAECNACRTEFEELERVLEITASVGDPEPGPRYGTEVWNRIEGKLPRAKRGWIAVPRWAFAGALGVLVVLAFLTGRGWRQPDVIVVETPAAHSTDVLRYAVRDHLERSERFLIEVLNSGRLDSAGARDLLVANRLYRQTARLSGDQEMSRVLEELERTLLELANRRQEIPSLEFDDLRQQVRGEGLLFRVRVFSSHLQAEEEL